MNKLKIGIYLNEQYDPSRGGSYSYFEQLLDKIDSFNFNEKIEIVFISKKKLNANSFNKQFLEIPISKFNSQLWTFKRRMFYKVFSSRLLKYFNFYKNITETIDREINSLITRFFSDNKIDLIYYLTPQINHFNYSYILTHWDMGIKGKFNCQKIFSIPNYEKIDYYNRISLNLAFAIFVESEQSKKDLIEIENIYREKIFVVPLMPGKVIELHLNENEQNDILNKWHLKKDTYFFYPAQFWGHKNHFGLVKAFKLVKERNPELKLVLSGSDKGNLDYIINIVEAENLENSVVFTGFVTNPEIYTFYKNAIALVMPTLLGPTNMPLLEAYHLGCRVLCSDIIGHKEQMQANAEYFVPFDHQQIAEIMLKSIHMDKPTIPTSLKHPAAVLNEHFLNLFNARKTFD